MVNYQDAKIYKLVCNVTGLVYIGSTVQPLYKRKYGHEQNFRRWKEGKEKMITTSCRVLEHRDYDIVLVESYPCKNQEELYRRERYWVDSTECVNKKRPIRTDEERLEDAMYNESARVRIYKWRSSHPDDYKELARKHTRKYYEQNKEAINEHRRQARRLKKA